MSRQAIALIAVAIPSIILHEVSHGWFAYLFGDDTAKRAGRLSLNPIRHIDPFGTIILPALLALTHSAVFGFAKPVPVNPRNMRDPRNHSLIVSLAGPGTNLVLALLSALAVRLTMTVSEIQDVYRFPDGAPWPNLILLFLGFINVVLAVFNLIPLPPLDGSALIERVLPASWWPRYLQLRQYSMGLLLVVFLMLPGIFGRIIEPAIRAWGELLV